MSWVCELAEDARKDLREVPKAIQERVARVMMQMATDPFQGNVKALQGKEWRGVFRQRIGDYAWNRVESGSGPGASLLPRGSDFASLALHQCDSDLPEVVRSGLTTLPTQARSLRSEPSEREHSKA